MGERGSINAHGDADVVTQVVTMAIKSEREQEFLDFAADFVKKVYANEPGTLLYVLTRHPTEPHTYVWMERYRNEGALKAHSETSYIAEAMSKLPEWWATQPELLKLTQVVPE